MKDIYIGLMSGTSIDSIDAALVNLEDDNKPKLIETYNHPIPTKIKNDIKSLSLPKNNEINLLGKLDRLLGLHFAEAANILMEKAGINFKEVEAIGSHGQTIRHLSKDINSDVIPFSLQIGDPNTIAENTLIKTVADFRKKDIALGGEGAPLTPAFHQVLSYNLEGKISFLNLGGIANITTIDKGQITNAYDIGPANILLDSWIQKNLNKNFDLNGEWARQGKINNKLMAALNDHPFFKRKQPKSTGREDFNLNWLLEVINTIDEEIKSVDVQSTLVFLTSRIITNELNLLRLKPSIIFCCGGGCKNIYLMECLKRENPNIAFKTTEALGIHPDWVEATAFAWLAKQNLLRKKINISHVTGAKFDSILGAIFQV